MLAWDTMVVIMDTGCYSCVCIINDEWSALMIIVIWRRLNFDIYDVQRRCHQYLLA